MTESTRLPSSLATWVEKLLGPLQRVRDASHARDNSRVWRVTGRTGDHYVKVDSSADLLALVLTAVDGEPLKESEAPARRRVAHRQAGQLLRRFHDAMSGPVVQPEAAPVSPSDHVTPRAALPAAQYAASRHATWLGAAAIITDEVGRVLLVHPTYRKDDSWLLPGGVVEPGEHPHVTCRREITEELGLDLPLSAVLAVHSFSQNHPDLQPGTACPGEVRFVFDGGTLTPDQVAAIRLPHEELSEYAFLETRDAVQRLRPVDGQIMLAAYRARFGNTATAHLADGRHILGVPPLDRHDVHVRYRPLWDSPLHHGPVPDRLPVQQAWAWCFVPDGRVVLVADPGPRGALPMLPGGTDTDATPEDTLHREAAEEAQLTLADPVRLGWVLDKTGEVYGGVGPNARLRLAAQVTAIGPAAVDPATGHPFARLLTTPAQAAALLGWGPPGARQAQVAAGTARERWGLPTARPAAIEEIPAEGMLLS